MIRSLALAFVSLLALPAHAQPSRTPAARAAAPRTTPAVAIGSPRSPGVAIAISAGATAASVVLLTAGVTRNDEALFMVGTLATAVAPSTGHWYAGRAVNPAMGVRAAALIAALTGLAIAESCGYFNAADDSGRDCDVEAGVMFGGVVVYSLAGVYEVVDAGRSARACNRRRGFDVAVMPTAAAADGGMAPRLVLSGRF